MAKTTKKPRTKRELDVLRDYACRLFLSGETQRVIAAKTGLTEATVSRWAREENWDARRREQNSSSAALVNSLMLAAKKISELIITKLNKGETDDIIDVIIDLEQWMMQRAETDEELTPELLTTINSLHKKYIEYISAQEA